MTEINIPPARRVNLPVTILAVTAGMLAVPFVVVFLFVWTLADAISRGVSSCLKA